MNTPNIVWTRIDERLLHGQIRITWGKHTEANLILVANDDAAEGPNAAFMQAGMKASAGGEYAVRFFSIQKTIDVISKASPRQKIFVLCNNPTDVARLVEGGVPITHCNVGNMHFHEGKRQIAKTVSVDETDIDAFKSLVANGVTCTIQNTPDQTPVDVLALASA
ncbi:PTS system mannose/fructose/N-acetylgalactosamine-transporter subunit IIB [Proteus vulgaris]|jgi:PTS system N-acetylgalactosamine-specific IIB component|uniref:N-acetylgalactosamine-specific PTS system, EIIB component n=1 Tax=Proteus vulgaris TaxID=585 RepID=A0A379FB75_PROVU|nr:MULTISPECIES: PTS N-acetylgalactosamine transporter subunit IIB [Proteus]RNT31887.1 PTS system mannose/fructose/N-acetylgalactosamine-transporter subunit IIB [Proteus mirabilis]AYY81690.1 PTS system mannose/fructose/N-acetylgalactosamine-transporter subunit IIB [Proteus vulgaris]KGA58357.1 PTS system, mannose/fructose/sorbose, IIB component family protein [Proteus vulgaris]MBG5972309.1 PTS system mannose/fructose/N-acetylgalactosamine-transporter subunit IIB [Proteus vulgaris]MBG5986662.1 P